MSYILDALTKNQAEQRAEDISVNLQPAPVRQTWPRWLAAAAGVMLVANLLFLAWLVWRPPPAPEHAPNTAAVAPQPSAPIRPVPVPDPVLPRSDPLASQAVTPRPQQPRPQPAPVIERVTVAQLPASERLLYDGFTYTTHIYTDDPSLCAIVIDGQRLTPGDAFKGLVVSAITEQGVVFEERRGSARRLVEVDLMAQWQD